MKERYRAGGLILATAWILAIVPVRAAAPPHYHYGEAWWWEARPDLETSLLLHFGPPTATMAETATQRGDEARARARQEADLFDLETIAEAVRRHQRVGGLDAELLDPEQMRFVPRSIPDPPEPGVIYDYSFNRRVFSLPEDGPRIVNEGRFGQALRFIGRMPLVLPSVDYNVPEQAGTPRPGGGDSVDFWMRIDHYPEQTAAVWEVFGGALRQHYGPAVAGARLLLHPDGRLQLELRHPHGRPQPGLWSPEELEAIYAGPGAVIFSREPVPLNRWFHVYCYNNPPTVQGGDSPMGVYLSIDGIHQAEFISERNNNYRFQGRGMGTWYLGNTHDNSMPFTGELDEFRVLHRRKQFYPRKAMPWIDPASERLLQFGEPFFLADGAVGKAR